MPKTIRLNATHYFIMKVSNKRELQQIASNRLSDIDFKDFLKIILKNHIHFNERTTLSSDNPLEFGKNLLQK